MNLFKLVGKISIDDKEKVKIKETANEAESSGSRIGGAFKKIGAAVATGLAVDKIAEFGHSCVENAATVQAESAQFTAAFGKMKPQAEAMFKGISKETGIMSNILKVEGTKAFSQFKGSGIEAGDALKMTERFTKLAADAAAYYDISLDEASERIRSFTRGNMEAGDAIGLFSSDAQRNSMAVEMYGKKWDKLTEAQKQNLMLKSAEKIYKDSGAMGQAAREGNNWATVTNNLKRVWKDFTAVLGTPVMKALIPVVKNISKSLQNLTADFQKGSKEGGNFTNKIADGITSGFPKLTNAAVKIIERIGSSLATGIPKMVQNGGKILDAVGNGIRTSLPKIANAGLNAILKFSASLMQNMPKLIGKGMDFIKNIISGLMQALPGFIAKAPTIISNFANAFNRSVPVMLQKGVAILLEVGKGLIKAIPTLIANIPKIFKAFIDVWTAMNWINLGKNLMNGIKSGIKNMTNNVKQFFADFGNNFKAQVLKIWETIKGNTTRSWNNIKNAILSPIKNAKGIVGTVLNSMKSFIFNIFKNIKTMTKGVWEGIKLFIKNPIEGAKKIVTSVVKGIKGICSTYFNTIKNVTKTVWNSIKHAISTPINAAKGIVKTVINSIKNTFTSVFNNLKHTTKGIWDGIKMMMTNPIKGAKQILSSVINGIKGHFSSVWHGIKSVTSSVWNSIANAIRNPMNRAKDFVSNIINRIKGFFHFSIRWPHIPLPHFKITPAGWNVGDLVKGKIPHLGIDWYANGGIMEKPTVFGLNPNTGNAMVGGEAGPEAIAPISKLQQYVGSAVKGENERLFDVLNRILILLADTLPNLQNKDIVLDTGVLVGGIAPTMKDELNRINRRESR